MNDAAPRTFTWDTLTPAQHPTFYFVGVTTGSSSIRRVFPVWAEELGLTRRFDGVELVGIDLAIHAPDDHYRTVVEFLKSDPLSLGALVTTHKIDLYRAAVDLFDEIDPLATLTEEVSSLSKIDGQLRAGAKDPISSGLAIEAFLPDHHFAEHESELLIFGAGGSAVAIDWYLSDPQRGQDRPVTITVSDPDRSRLDTLAAVHRSAGRDPDTLRTVRPDEPGVNDQLLAAARPGSLVINATGLGKDAPGSPLSDRAVFPERSIVWDLNYRGDLLFLDQARAQQNDRHLQVEDGWVYFIHGWTQVIAEVFAVDIPTRGPAFDNLSRLAGGTRR